MIPVSCAPGVASSSLMLIWSCRSLTLIPGGLVDYWLLAIPCAPPDSRRVYRQSGVPDAATLTLCLSDPRPMPLQALEDRTQTLLSTVSRTILQLVLFRSAHEQSDT